MKKVITTVGTSIFENFKKRYPNSIDTQYETLKDKEYSEYDNYKAEIKIIKASLNGFLNDFNDSAEIKSLNKLKSCLNEEIQMFFISSDTILSKLACDILNEFYKDSFNSIEIKIIKGLKVKNRREFETIGLINLVNYFYNNITQGYFDNCILNITGGYKGVIPFLTILGQVNSIPLYYIFEETEELIKIPQAPIDINWKIFDKYFDDFEKLDNDEVIKSSNLNYGFINECSSCLELSEDDVCINPLGKILWERYKSRYFMFYSTDEVWKVIQSQRDIKRILKNKFSNKELRKSKTEHKGQHYVYDDGNNNNRIYYFEDSDRLFIYKTFQNEEQARNFINSSIDKESYKNSSKLRKLKK